MGAVKIWNAMEVADQARKDYSSEILHSSLSIDPSLPLPDMKPRIVFVLMPLCFSIFIRICLRILIAWL
ncbi:hypothetical protein L6164_014362 [Bauhinia variegata]|uniref:Uncharacterized protein n=1 Tax=Bauhinia variegata TaxID=167791 RepID=A0ACB9NLX1_BAUVA|nr:hypothetical protein L6164_014362 [Bauhinia variegata]